MKKRVFEWDQKIECRCQNRKKVAKLKEQTKMKNMSNWKDKTGILLYIKKLDE